MPKDDRDVLEVLKAELDFIKKGGYGRSVRTPWKPTSIFEDSLSCLNFGDPKHTHPCSECLLTEFVPPASRSEQVPCHQIPVGEHGETIEDFSQKENQEELEGAVKLWLLATIRRIEATRAQLSAAHSRLPNQPAPKERGKRVLIVDDDEQVLMKLESRLEAEGYSTTTAWSGQEALRLLRTGAFDLVLLDDFLTDVSTDEVLRQAQTMPSPPPTLLLWAKSPAQSEIARSTRLGASGHAVKQHMDQVVQNVERLLCVTGKSLPPNR